LKFSFFVLVFRWGSKIILYLFFCSCTNSIAFHSYLSWMWS